MYCHYCTAKDTLDVKGQQGMFFVPESRISYFCLRRSHLRLLAINLAARTTQFINMTSPVLDLSLSDAALFLSIQLWPHSLNPISIPLPKHRESFERSVSVAGVNLVEKWKVSENRVSAILVITPLSSSYSVDQDVTIWNLNLKCVNSLPCLWRISHLAIRFGHVYWKLKDLVI